MSLFCLPLCVGSDRDLPRDLIVKVKYEGMLRRFNIFIAEDGYPAFSLGTLRYKICNLFKFNFVSDIIITYIDEDNDVINMVDEYDFLDAIRQGLNPLRLEVFLTSQKDVGAIMGSSTETSTLKTFAIPKGNYGTLNPASICLDETLKDLSEILPMTHTEDAGPFDSFNMHTTTSGFVTEGWQGLEPCGDTQVNNGTTHNEQENENDFEFQAGPSGLSLSIETHCDDNCHHGPENLSGVADYLKMDNVGDSNRHWRNLSEPSVTPPSYSRRQGSSISSLLSSVEKMDNQSPGTLDCYLVKNVTIFEGVQLSHGIHFTKIWRLRNAGTLPWPLDTQLVRIWGDDFGSGNEAELETQDYGYPVGGDFDAAIHCIAPIQPGQYASYWCLMAPSGEMFGQRLRLLVEVVESSKQGFLPHPMKSFPTAFKDPIVDAGSSKQKLFGRDIFWKVYDEKCYTSDDKMDLGPPDVVVTIPDGSSMIKQPGEKPYVLTVQGSGVPIQLQGVNRDTTFSYYSVEENSLLHVPVNDASKGNFAEFPNVPSWVISDINSFSGKNPNDVNQMEQFLHKFEGMGFHQTKLNADDVPSNNDYDLKNTLDAQRVPAEWNPIVEALQEMIEEICNRDGICSEIIETFLCSQIQRLLYSDSIQFCRPIDVGLADLDWNYH